MNDQQRDDPAGASNGKLPDKIKFDYLKSNFFRVIHADGVWGGLTPSQDVLITFWNERAPIPKQMTYRVNPDGNLGEEVKEERISRDAIVREVETSVVISLATARAFVTWLQDRINQADQVVQTGSEGEGHASN